MRRIKSRILFEQMLGRATRLCPEINKTHFRIFNAVGIYESLEPVSEMKPVVVNPTENFTHLLDTLKNLEDDKVIQRQVNQIIAKLRRLKFNEQISKLIDAVKNLPAQDAKNFFLSHKGLFQSLQETISRSRMFVISEHEDECMIYRNLKRPKLSTVANLSMTHTVSRR